MLRAAVNAGGDFQATVKWTNPLFILMGPYVVFQRKKSVFHWLFFQGWSLMQCDAHIDPSGKLELANLVMLKKTEVNQAIIFPLAATAAALDLEYGDPTARR